MAGLKVSDHPFGFVLFTQRDTITKGLKLPVTFRVNPSGIPFAQDMVAVDNMADTPYILVEESTKASYVTPSKNFQIDSLGKTRNAAKEETDGQCDFDHHAVENGLAPPCSPFAGRPLTY